MQQKISTPSVIDIRDEVILANASYPQPVGQPDQLTVAARDPWDAVLAEIDLFSLTDSALSPTNLTIVPAMDNTKDAPSAINPFMTRSHFTNRMVGVKMHVLVGPPGSNCDYEGTDGTPFAAAIAAVQARNSNGGWIIVMPGTYTLTSTLSIPAGICIEGMRPLTTIIQSGATLPVGVPLVTLAGDLSSLSLITVAGTHCTSSPAIKVTGSRGTLDRVKTTGSPFLGIQILGNRSYMRGCRVESSAGWGVWVQGLQQRVQSCSFGGTLPSGAIKIEGSECGVFACNVNTSVTGKPFQIPSGSCMDNSLVGNHFGSVAPSDYGTRTVRYANTPNTANTNSFLLPLQLYTGQPTVTSNQMVTSNSFTHTASEHDDAAILSAIDLFVQRSYEDRNLFIVSEDPTYDSDGAPLTGAFTWNGATRTLTYPNFTIRSVIQPYSWTVAAGSNVIPSGSILQITLDRQTISSANVALTPSTQAKPRPLSAPTDSQTFVLAVGLDGTNALWLDGFRLLGSVSHSSVAFDADGVMLPLVQFIGPAVMTNDEFSGLSVIGPSEIRNPPPPFDGFAAAAATDLTTKLGVQSALLKSLFERTNLNYQRLGGAEIRADVEPNGWLQTADLSVGLSGQTPTHFQNLKGTTYCLVPTAGLFYYDRSTNPKAFTHLAGCPSDTYTSLSRLGTGLALLSTSRQVMLYEPDSVPQWTTHTPTTFSPDLPLSFASSRPPTFQTGGMSDFALQTSDYTYFTTLEGLTVRYALDAGTLEVVPRIFQDDGTNLLGSHLKDTGYNTAYDSLSLFPSGNGGFATLSGLPGGSNSVLTVPIEHRAGLISFNPETMTCEALSHDPNSGAFLAVYHDATTFYIVGGGFGRSQIHDRILMSEFVSASFAPHHWVVNAASQEIYLLGCQTTDNAFAEWYGKLGSNDIWAWTVRVIGAANSCQGVVGVIDGLGSQEVYALTSGSANGYAPKLWCRHGGLWDQSWTGSGTFTYSHATDSMKAMGVSSPKSVTFLFQDSSRSGRPTALFFNKSTLAIGSYQLTEGIYAKADTNSIQSVYGAFYHPTFRSMHWFTKSGSQKSTHFMVFEDIAGWSSWNVADFGVGGTYLTTTDVLPPPKRSASVACRSHTAMTRDGVVITDYVYLTTPAGTIRGALTGNYLAISTQNWTVFDRRSLAVSTCYSSFPTSTYSEVIGFSRSDLSLQIGSRIETALPTISAVSSGPKENESGMYWFDPGVKVRQASNKVWVGINRVSSGYGYLWVGDASASNQQVELKSLTASYRGDVVPSGGTTTFGSTDDYDMAWDGTGTLLAIVFRNNTQGGFLSLVVYNSTTRSFTHQAIGSDYSIPGASALGWTPRIVWNTNTNAWIIVGQTTAGKLDYYTRDAIGAWTFEAVTTISGSAYATNGAKKPARPIFSSSGEVIVALESGATNSLWLVKRNISNAWVTVYQSGVDGFAYPQTAVSADGIHYWVFGSHNGISTAGKCAHSTDPGNQAGGWSLVSTSTLYDRAQIVACSPIPSSGSSVVVAASLRADGAISSNQEIGVFRFNADTSVNVSAFTAKGRLQTSVWSGDEESSFSDLSFTPDNRLICRASRPSRSFSHYSVWRSHNGWAAVGESLLGSGRHVTIGKNHYREQWVGDSNQPLIQAANSNGLTPPMGHLPLAQRTTTDYVLLKWPYSSYSGRLFGFGSTSWSDDVGLESGTLPAATARYWPLLSGQTLLDHAPGASSLYWGSMFSLAAPPSTTNVAYFGVATIGAVGIFKIKPTNLLVLNGTHSWRVPNDASRSVTLVGPVKFSLDTQSIGSHLVMQFPLTWPTLDTTAHPLTGWSSFNYPTTQYAVALAELREQTITLYPKLSADLVDNKLTLAVFEPREMVQSAESWRFHLPSPFASIHSLPRQFQIDAISSDVVKIKDKTGLRGMQRLSFPTGISQQLILRGAIPGEGHYLYLRPGTIGKLGSAGEIIYILAGRYGDLLSWHESLT